MKKILVIDDSDYQQKILDSILTKNGFEVLIACDGIQGLASTRKHNPDLIILDTMMPKMDGIMVCGLLKKDAKTKSIPVLMLSARSEEKDQELYKKVQADAFMAKPPNFVELINTINTLLDKSSGNN